MEAVVQMVTNDLRVALLLAGGVLLLVIVLWEVIQRRKAARADSTHLRGPLGQARIAKVDDLASGDPLLDLVRREPLEPSVAEDAGADRLEPTLTLPEIHVRDRLSEPPLVDFDQAMTSVDRGNSIPVMQSVTPEPSVTPVERAAPTVSLPKNTEPIIVAVRVVAREGERLTGAALRQALQGEGFVHGVMEIFHRALADGRVLMSAASLTKPGSFDLTTMDSMRYLGINLFAVLPGPVSGRDAVDKLLSVGHTLAQRLRANLLDSRGQALTETRLAEMRREAASAGGD